MKLSSEIFDFLSELKLNNHRHWFLENKGRFELIQKDLILFTAQLLSRIEKFDSSIKGVDPKSCIFRIYKDVRFSKDQNPYKTHIGIFMRSGNKKIEGTGYYLHIEPGGSLLGGGCYRPDPISLYKIRDRIANDSKSFLKIIRSKSWIKNFGEEFYAEKVKTCPKGFSKDHPMIDFIRYKGFAVTKKMKDSDLSVSEMIDTFRLLYPFNKYLDAALK